MQAPTELFAPAPAALPAPAIVLAPEMYGVNDYLRDVARDFAASGFFVLALDVLWRTERGLVLAYDGPDNVRAHALHDAFDFSAAAEDVQEAVDMLRAMPGANGRVGIVGFCLGGTVAYVAAANTNVDAAVGYYGSRIVEFVDDVPKIRCPLLLHFGAADCVIPDADRERVVAAAATNPRIATTVHAGAQHAFANRVRPDRFHREAAAVARNSTLAFLQRTLQPALDADWANV